MKMAFWVGVPAFFSLLVYLGYVIWKAKYEVDSAPRVPMFLCDKHGPLEQKYVMQLDVMSDKPAEYCSFCFHEKMEAANRKGLIKKS